jgi:hypothetical protein
MIQAAFSLLVFLTFTIGSMDLGLLLFQYQTMARAINQLARCKAIDENNTLCANSNDFVAANTFGMQGISVQQTNSCSAQGGGAAVQYTGTLAYSPFLVAPLRNSYRVTYCFARQW